MCLLTMIFILFADKGRKMMEQEKIYNDIKHQIDHIRRIEESVKRKPTAKDLKETVKLCKDFGLKISIDEIPNLHSVCALEKWRIKRITDFLDSR